MQIKHARIINIFWAPDETINHTLATTLRDLPPDANAYTIDEAAEHRHIIKKHESLDPMKAFADLTREMHKLPIHD